MKSHALIRCLFVTAYAAGTVFFIIRILEIMGIIQPFGIYILLCVTWVGICFSAQFWIAPTYLAVSKVRKPILEEEEWLNPIINELGFRSGSLRLPRLLILEEIYADSFCTGRDTIVLSRGLIIQLTADEIKAVIAHELGHLKDKETLLASAWVVAQFIPNKVIGGLVYGSVRLVVKSLQSWSRRLFGVSVLLGIFVLLLFGREDLILLLVIVIIFILIYPIVRMLMTIIWCGLNRASEYRQDRFAQSLGYGKELKSALLKMDSMDSEGMATRWMQLFRSHPLLSARIRRLEWLEGLRATP